MRNHPMNKESYMTKLKEFDLMSENFFVWLIGQYDPKTGGFFHARSSFSHDDQEGFYIVEGTGWAKIDDEESANLKLFWFHAAI